MAIKITNIIMNRTKLVGILNLTPDSFSDGNNYNSAEEALKQFKNLTEQGAEVIDIGAISTRPNNQLISAEEEILRYKIVLKDLAPHINSSNCSISIDSFNYETLYFLKNIIKFDWVNDQSGAMDPRIINFADNFNKKYVLMHNLGLPANPSIILAENCNIIEEITRWFTKKIEILYQMGLKKDQIILDPGIGFGKNANQNWQIINNAEKFLNLNLPIMIGHSRKSFLNLITDKPFSQRDPETASISKSLAKKKIHYLRVHNIKINKEAIKDA